MILVLENVLHCRLRVGRQHECHCGTGCSHKQRELRMSPHLDRKAAKTENLFGPIPAGVIQWPP